MNRESCCQCHFCNSCCTSKAHALLHSTTFTSLPCQFSQMAHHCFSRQFSRRHTTSFSCQLFHTALHAKSPQTHSALCNSDDKPSVPHPQVIPISTSEGIKSTHAKGRNIFHAKGPNIPCHVLVCRLDIPCAVDMRQMPPSVAEVYVLSMVASLKRISQNK